MGVAIATLLGCIALTRFQLGLWQDNVKLWEHTVRVCGESCDSEANLAKAYQDQDNIEEAIHHYRAALRLGENSWAENGLGTAWFQQGKALEAQGISMLQQGKAEEGRSKLQEAQGKFKDAAAQFRKTIAKYAYWAQPHFNLGLALAQIGRKDEAMSEYRETLRREPDHAPAHSELGILLLQTGLFAEAASHFQLALENGLADAANYYGLGHALVRCGRAAQAVAALERAVALEPKVWQGHCLLAYALHEAGNILAAREQYRETTRLNPAWCETIVALTLPIHPEVLPSDVRTRLKLYENSRKRGSKAP